MALIYQSARQHVQGPLMKEATWDKLGALSHLVPVSLHAPNQRVYGVELVVGRLLKDGAQLRTLARVLEPDACATLRRMSANFAVDVESAIGALEQLNTALERQLIVEPGFMRADLAGSPPMLFCETPQAMATLRSSTAPFTSALPANITDAELFRTIGKFIADQMQAGSLLTLDQLTAEQETAVWGVLRGQQTLDLLVNVEAIFPALGIVPNAHDVAPPIVERKPWEECSALLMPLSKFDLSKRIVDILKHRDIVYLGEVACYTERELLKLPGFAGKSLKQLKAILAEHGLTPGMFPPSQRAVIRAAAEAYAAKSG